MAEYTDNDAGRAQAIVDGLLNREGAHLKLDPGLSIIDVEQDSEEFLDDVDILNEIGAKFPALQIGESLQVPIALSTLGFDSFPFRRPALRRSFRRYPGLFRREILDYYYALRDDGRLMDGAASISTEEARETFAQQATGFLAQRIAAIRSFGLKISGSPPTLNLLQRIGGFRVRAPGCNFSVSADTPGLRVFWSGAYYIVPNYFGHPTSPTVSTLQSGSYIFGVDGGAYGNTIQWDTAAICRLPGKASVHLNY